MVILPVGLELLHASLGGQGQGHLGALGLGQAGGALLDDLGGVLEGHQVEAALLGGLLTANSGQLKLNKISFI